MKRILSLIILLSAITSLAAADGQVTKLPDQLRLLKDALSRLEVQPKLSLKTNSNFVLVTIHCKDIGERNKILDGLRTYKSHSMAATRTPPTVTVTFIQNAAEYKVTVTRSALEGILNSKKAALGGKVEQRLPEGLLISTGVKDAPRVYVCGLDVTGYTDGAAFLGEAWEVGQYSYKDLNQVQRFVMRFTCDYKEAADYWRPVAERSGRTETEKRIFTAPDK